MTVSELIEKLKACSPEAEVYVNQAYSGIMIELDYVDEDIRNNEVKLRGE